MDNIMFTNEEKKGYMEMIMYCLDFRSHMKVQDTAVCISICTRLAQLRNLDQRTKELLYYGALIHDIGMLSIPKEVIESDRKLTDDEMEMMRKHVDIGRQILESRLENEALEVAVRHHERCNGSGYPQGLTGTDMSMPQKILQLADAVTGMINDRPHRKGLDHEKVREILTRETQERSFDPELMKVFFAHFNEILSGAAEQGRESLKANARVISLYRKLEEQMKQMKK